MKKRKIVAGIFSLLLFFLLPVQAEALPKIQFSESVKTDRVQSGTDQSETNQSETDQSGTDQSGTDLKTADPNYETPEEKEQRKKLEASKTPSVVRNLDGEKEQKKKTEEKKEKLKTAKQKYLEKQQELLKEKAVKSGIVCIGSTILPGSKSVWKENLFSEEIRLLKVQTQKFKKEFKTAKEEYEQAKNKKVQSIIFDPQNISRKSNITEKDMKKALEGTALEQYASVFVKIERKYGVNAVAMASIAALESNWGTSRRAVKDHNYTGFGVYSDSAEGINAKSGEENLEMTAKHLADNYLRPDGMYYNGTSIFAVNERYCVGHTWGMKVTNIACGLMEKLRQS